MSPWSTTSTGRGPCNVVLSLCARIYSVDRARPSRFSVQPRGCTHKPPYSTGEARRAPAAREQPDSELRATKKSRAALLLGGAASPTARCGRLLVGCSSRNGGGGRAVRRRRTRCTANTAPDSANWARGPGSEALPSQPERDVASLARGPARLRQRAHERRVRRSLRPVLPPGTSAFRARLAPR